MNVEQFHAIELQVPSCRVILEPGEGYGLEYELSKSSEVTIAAVQNGVLVFQCRHRWPRAFFFWGGIQDYVRVTYPANVKLENVRIEAISGSLELRGLQTDWLELKSDSGRITLSELSAGDCNLRHISGSVHADSCGFGLLTSNGVSGGVHLQNVAINGLSCKTVSGSVELNGEPRGNLQIQTGSGSVRVDSRLSLGDSAWELSSVSGSKRVNGEKAEIYRRDDAPNQFRVRTTSGSIHLSFAG